jgi:lysophospholipase L1-like esterase
MSWLRNLFAKKPRILFVGDSITASTDASYSYLIKNARKDLSVDVLAKPGMTTNWMLQNLRPQLFSNNYDKVFVYGGVNDAFNDSVKIEKTMSNLQEMVNLITNDGARAYIISGIEPIGFMDVNKMPLTKWVTKRSLYTPMVEKYKKIQNLMPLQIKNATIVPKIQLAGSLTADGIHPNVRGQQIMRDNIIKYV